MNTSFYRELCKNYPPVHSRIFQETDPAGLHNILIMDCNIGILAHDIRLNPAVFGQHKDIITPGRRNKIPWNTMPAGNRVIDRIIKFLCPAQDLCLTVHFFQCTVSGISCTAKRRTVEVIHVKAADPFCQYFCLTPAFFCQGIQCIVRIPMSTNIISSVVFPFLKTVLYS